MRSEMWPRLLVSLTLPFAVAVWPVAAQELEWSAVEIGTGIKPALALDGNDVPHIAYLTEAISGATFYATNAGGQWATEEIAQGYFYGPVDIDVAPDGVPTIVYHDHESSSFDPSLGSGVVLIRSGGTWQQTKISDVGHDQWDTDVAAAAGGIWHVAGIDPVQFGSQDGLEYATNASGDPLVEKVGSGPIPYEFGVSIELAANGGVGISYFDANTQDLRYGERNPGEGGDWSIETVFADGDSGRYSDLAYDADSAPHISFWTFESRSSGTVSYAWRDGSGLWRQETVGTLSDVASGMTGARKITAIELDAAGVPHIMYGDRSGIFYAVRGGDGTWSRQEALSSDGRFGQLVEFALGSDGKPHVTYFEVTKPSPLEGTVFYASGG